jgi:endonuclease/exonuclease/phosphatase family metal-dependent hydrolase
MRRFALVVSLCGLTAGCGGSGTPQPISVLTRNLYLGAALEPLASALTPEDLQMLAGGVWHDVLESRYPERAVGLAGEIALANPDVVCLQEVSLYRTQSPGDWQSGAAPDASEVQLDFLEILLAALQTKGLSYRAVTVGTNADEELPALVDGTLIDVRLTDRDAILVRDDVTAVPGPLMTFPTALIAPVGGAGGTTLTFVRGFVTADVTVGDKTVRVINAHLEVGALNGRVQEQQARELVAAIAPYKGAAILAGDFNSPPDGSGTQSYNILTKNSGLPHPFRDTFDYQQGVLGARLGGQFAGTCCVDLMKPEQVLAGSRLDLILFGNGVAPVDATIVAPIRTSADLWPSDHLGYFAQLEIK